MTENHGAEERADDKMQSDEVGESGEQRFLSFEPHQQMAELLLGDGDAAAQITNEPDDKHDGGHEQQSFRQ
jgi:hypothetical protein